MYRKMSFQSKTSYRFGRQESKTQESVSRTGNQLWFGSTAPDVWPQVSWRSCSQTEKCLRLSPLKNYTTLWAIFWPQFSISIGNNFFLQYFKNYWFSYHWMWVFAHSLTFTELFFFCLLYIIALISGMSTVCAIVLSTKPNGLLNYLCIPFAIEWIPDYLFRTIRWEIFEFSK